MRKIKALAFVSAILFMLAAVSHNPAVAQTTMFNAPTTDVTGKDKVFLEFQYLRQVPDQSTTPTTSIYVPRALVGLGNNIEVGANVAFVNTEGTSRTNAFFSPNIKWRFYENEEHGLAASGGGILFTPINNRADSNTFGLIYSNVSKKIRATYGPRFTAGVYGIVGSSDAEFAGPRAGAIVGYEQPFHPKLSFAADWMSGKNGFGFFTPGVVVNLPKNSQFKLGYSFGNDTFAKNDRDKDNRFLFVRYGITF